MLVVSPELKSFRLSAGEPFLFDVRMVKANSVADSLTGREFVVAFYGPSPTGRTLIDLISGIHQTDAKGDYMRFVRDGSLSEQLYLEKRVVVEVAERFRNGKEVLAMGTLTVETSADDIPSLSNGVIGQIIARSSIISLLPAPNYKYTVVYELYDDIPMVPPVVASPVFSINPNITPDSGDTMTQFRASNGQAV